MHDSCHRLPATTEPDQPDNSYDPSHRDYFLVVVCWLWRWPAAVWSFIFAGQASTRGIVTLRPDIKHFTLITGAAILVQLRWPRVAGSCSVGTNLRWWTVWICDAGWGHCVAKKSYWDDENDKHVVEWKTMIKASLVTRVFESKHQGTRVQVFCQTEEPVLRHNFLCDADSTESRVGLSQSKSNIHCKMREMKRKAKHSPQQLYCDAQSMQVGR